MIMKKLLFSLIILIVGFELYAQRKIEIQHSGQNPGHSGLPIWPADQPDVYFDDVEMVITIDGSWSESSYYDVEIISMSTLDTELSTRVTSSNSSIDISSLPEDYYKITITSSLDNTYQGFFTTY